MSNELKFQLWSLVELPKEVRNLQFPHYPFVTGKLGPLPADVEALFQKYQIIYYRDEVMPFGLILDPLDEDTTPIVDRSGFMAYRSSGVCDRENLAMCRWTPDRQPDKYRKLVKKHGDDYMWLMWNKVAVVQEMNEERVRCV